MRNIPAREKWGLPFMLIHTGKRNIFIILQPKPHLLMGGSKYNISIPQTTTITWHGAGIKYSHLVRISGADIHNADLAGLAGVAFRYRIKDTRHFVDALRAGDAYLIIDGKITDREGKPVEE